jgi:hypothetical protein
MGHGDPPNQPVVLARLVHSHEICPISIRVPPWRSAESTGRAATFCALDVRVRLLKHGVPPNQPVVLARLVHPHEICSISILAPP